MIWILGYLVAGALIWVFLATRLSEGRDAVIFALVLVGWPLVGVFAIWVLLRERQAPHEARPTPAEPPPFAVRKQDLGEVLSIDEIEARERVQDPLGAVPDLPFGHLNPAWTRFKAGLASGAPIATFSRAFGRRSQDRYEGYAEVRADEIERWFVASIRKIEQ